MYYALIIDADRDDGEALACDLRTAGFDVSMARTGHEALTRLQDHVVDLVVADLRLVDLSGIEVLQGLRRAPMQVPVILTGIDSTAAAVEAGRLGAVAYLEKPLAPGAITDLARASVNGRGPRIERRLADASNTRVYRALRVIDRRYHEPRLNVRLAAGDVGVSTEHLCRLLKKHTGHTFASLLRGVRFDAAIQLLRTTNLSMKEIAGRVGFSSASRFDRDFKRMCGVPPGAYRLRDCRRPPRGDA